MNAVAVTGATVVLTLASGVAKDESVTVSYTVPSAADAAPITDSAGNAAPGLSGEPVTNETPAVGNRAPSGLPTITGTAQIGETLRASTSAITDADGLDGVTFIYQWIANDGVADAEPEDATASTYTALSNDMGKTLKVRVTFIDEGGTEETLTSAATEVITAALTASFHDTPERCRLDRRHGDRDLVRRGDEGVAIAETGELVHPADRARVGLKRPQPSSRVGEDAIGLHRHHHEVPPLELGAPEFLSVALSDSDDTPLGAEEQVVCKLHH